MTVVGSPYPVVSLEPTITTTNDISATIWEHAIDFVKSVLSTKTSVHLVVKKLPVGSLPGTILDTSSGLNYLCSCVHVLLDPNNTSSYTSCVCRFVL